MVIDNAPQVEITNMKSSRNDAIPSFSYWFDQDRQCTFQIFKLIFVKTTYAVSKILIYVMAYNVTIDLWDWQRRQKSSKSKSIGGLRRDPPFEF